MGRWRLGKRVTIGVALACAGLGAALLVGGAVASLSGTTNSCSDTAVTGPASSVSATSELLTGSVQDPCPTKGYTFYFDYATDAYYNANDGGYSDSTDPQNSPDPSFSQTQGGLLPNTMYHYRLVVSSLEATGNDATFRTGAPSSPSEPQEPVDPNADLAVSVLADKTSPVVGDTLTYTVTVHNNGPREATAVKLTDTLPAQVEFQSASFEAPPVALRRLQVACSGGSTVICDIGPLGFGSTATAQIVTLVTGAGEAIDTATASNKDQPDPNGANSTGATTITVQAPTQTPTVPGPIYGQTANIDVVSGTVLIRLPGTTAFVPLTGLTSIPEGTEVDTTNGRVALTSASNPANDTQTSQFYDGRFVFSYEPPRQGTVPPLPGTPATLVTQLLLSNPLTCPKSKQRSLTAPAKQRSLWGSGKGNFRTRGKFAAATVRGTIWFTQDTCTTTFVKVKQGTVDVFDFVLNKHFIVPAGSNHTAKKKP